jgi:hypothetical protein
MSAIQIVRPLESIADRNRAGSRLLFLAEFLEGGIGAQRVPGNPREQESAGVIDRDLPRNIRDINRLTSYYLLGPTCSGPESNCWKSGRLRIGSQTGSTFKRAMET